MNFETWLHTEQGKSCVDDTRQPIKNPYLKNRLYYAFEAGVNSGDQDVRLRNQISTQTSLLFRYKEEVKKLKKKLNRVMEGLRNG